MQSPSSNSQKLLMFALILLSATLFPVAQGQSPSADIYANMLGIWGGFDDTTLHGVTKHIPVEILIKREKDGVQMDYTYSQPGEADFSKITKFMKLDAKRSNMTLRWESAHGSGATYKTSSLDEFARTGFGRFTATGPAVSSGGGKGKFEFNLDAKTISYVWLSEAEPGNYIPVTTFTLHRINQ